MKEKILDAQKMEITTADVYSRTRESTPRCSSCRTSATRAMNAAVQQRLSQVTTWRNLTAGITAIALAFALALSWLITRSLRRRSRAPSRCSATSPAGKYDNEIDRTGTDEAGQVLQRAG